MDKKNIAVNKNDAKNEKSIRGGSAGTDTKALIASLTGVSRAAANSDLAPS